MHRIVVLLLLLPLSACATGRSERRDEPATDPGVAAGPEDRLICRREVVTGSKRRRRVCKYESQRRAEREAADRKIGAARENTPVITDTSQPLQ